MEKGAVVDQKEHSPEEQQEGEQVTGKLVVCRMTGAVVVADAVVAVADGDVVAAGVAAVVVVHCRKRTVECSWSQAVLEAPVQEILGVVRMRVREWVCLHEELGCCWCMRNSTEVEAGVAVEMTAAVG